MDEITIKQKRELIKLESQIDDAIQVWLDRDESKTMNDAAVKAQLLLGKISECIANFSINHLDHY